MPEPLDILVLTDEPFQASYLASVLDLEAPGLFRVRHVGRGTVPSPPGADLVIVQGGFAPGESHGHLSHGLLGPSRAPVIFVARGALDLPFLDRLMHEGADDVLDLGELSARGLAAAVLKAVRRRSRSVVTAAPTLLGAVAETAA